MKLILLSLVFSHCLLFGQQYSHNQRVDEKYGFKELKFEMNEADFTKSVKNINTNTKEEGLVRYKITDERYAKVGSCELSEVYATFFNKQLLSIVIKTKGTNSGCMLDVLTSQFGDGFKSNQFMENYAWLGDKAVIMYDKNELDDDADIYMSSTPLSDKYTAFLKSKGISNSKDF